MKSLETLQKIAGIIKIVVKVLFVITIIATGGIVMGAIVIFIAP